MTQSQTDDSKRVERAPGSCGLGSLPNMISVVLGDDEDVCWCWTHYPNGESVVTGYEIVKKDQDDAPRGFSFERAVGEMLWPEKKRQEKDVAQTGTPARSPDPARRPVGFLSSAFRRAG